MRPDETHYTLQLYTLAKSPYELGHPAPSHLHHYATPLGTPDLSRHLHSNATHALIPLRTLHKKLNESAVGGRSVTAPPPMPATTNIHAARRRLSPGIWVQHDSTRKTSTLRAAHPTVAAALSNRNGGTPARPLPAAVARHGLIV